jgi:hypothetical protein
MICWRCHSNSVNTVSRLPICSDIKTRKRQYMVGIVMIRNYRIWSSTIFLLYHYTSASRRGRGGILFYLCPSVPDIFRHIFLSNYWWQKSDIWSQASYRYPISLEAFLDPSDSYFLFADLIKIHIEHICSFFVAFFSATIDGRDLIFGHKLHIGTPYSGKHFFYTPAPRRGKGVYCFTSVRPRYFLSHFSQ